jgi:hypothetical protein
MRYCPRCDNTRWVCENHLDRLFLGERACGCGGAGAPCPGCNKVLRPQANQITVQYQPWSH